VVVRVKPDKDSKRWAKATVDKEIDVRSYQARTEDGRTYRRNRRHLTLTKEPFSRATSPESPGHQDLPNCPVPVSANMEASDGPTVNQNKAMNLFASPMVSVQFLFLLPVRLRLL